MITRVLRRLIPKPLLSLYHYCLARVASLVYRNPSNELIVIGVTGTSGKTTTSYLIAQLLELAGETVGLTGTALFKIGKREWLNDRKMTMLGRWETHRLLRQMVDAGCRYAVIETSSEGIAQHRHVGIHYDVCIFTNLTPEHLEAHGGFENYKAAKLKLFTTLARLPHKKLAGQIIKKSIVVNLDTEHSADFLAVTVDRKITFSTSEKLLGLAPQPLVAQQIAASATGLSFTIGSQAFAAPLLGRFNIANLLAALGTMTALGWRLPDLAPLLPHVKPCPGRLERIEAGQPFTVIVDYAFEPNALRGLYSVVDQLKTPGTKVIQVLGSTGGGRDKKPRPLKGELAAAHADVVIVTNEDPYDEDPSEIIAQVAAGARGRKTEGRDLFRILDRREAIRRAVSKAAPGDIVLITGKGCEQKMVVKNGVMIDWDDRAVVREELATLSRSQMESL